MQLENKEKRQFWVILSIVFLGFLGISMPYLVFPTLFLNPEASILPVTWGDSGRAISLGVTLAAYPFGQFIGSPILGSLSDDYGRKKILSGTLLLAAICYLFSGIAISGHYLGLLIASRFVAGLMEGNIAIVRAMAADMTTIKKHDAFGKINAVISVAYLVGPFLGGLMADKEVFQNFNASTPFYLTCILFFGLSIVSLFTLDEKQILKPLETRTFWERINLFKRLSVLFSNKHLQFFMIVSTSFTLAADIFYEFGPVYLTLKWGLGPAKLVFYNAVLCVGLVIGNGWLPSIIASRASSRLSIIYSIGAFGFLLMGMVFTNSPLFMMLLCALSGLVIGLAVTLLTVKISNTVSESLQGEVMGVQLSLRVLGDALICLFGGVLLLLSSKLILVFAAVLSVAVMIYYRLKDFDKLS